MKQNQTCPKCGSTQIRPNLCVTSSTVEYGPQDLSLQVEENPNATLLKGEKTYPLSAWVCMNCGYTELYVADIAGVDASLRRADLARAKPRPQPGAPANCTQALIIMGVVLVLSILAYLAATYDLPRLFH